MEFHNTSSSWLQHQPSTSDGQTAHHHEAGRLLSTESWKDRPTLVDASAAQLAPSVQQSLDLSDFTLGDLSASPAVSVAAGPSTQPYFGTFSANNIYFPSTTSPYNTVSYSAWSATQQAAAAQVPLSSYSSLNGATTTTPTPTSLPTPPQQQYPHSSQPQQQMMIDPALTLNGSTSSGLTPHYSSSTYPSQPSQQQTQPPSYQYQHLHPHEQSTTVQPSYIQTSRFIQSSLQPSSQSQGTLSPHALHSPSASTSIANATSLADARINAPTKTEHSEARKAAFMNSVRPLMQPNSFTGAGAVQALVSQIVDFGSSEVDAASRMEILTRLRDNAGNHYFRAWVENGTAIDITREWLKAGFTAKNDTALVETVMPLLHIIDRLPLTIESLKTSKLGKIVVKLVKDPPAPAIKDMASNLERKWRQMLEEVNANAADDTSSERKGKKRKLNEPPAQKNTLTAKKSSTPLNQVAPAPSRVALVKKEVKPSVVTAVKDAKSDSSFFSAPKPKPKLPTFKKAPVAVPVLPSKKDSEANVAQPSLVDPFQEVLKSMKARKGSPAVATPPPTSAPASTTSTAPTRLGKKRKSVTWAPDSQLESIKLIERAIYDDDPEDGIHRIHNLRDLDRGEGAALHAHLFEEAIDWSESIPLDLPPDVELSVNRGAGSTEKAVQEEREKTALVARYMSAAQIPDSPSEPLNAVADGQVDKEVKIMTCGPEADMLFWTGPTLSTNQSVADLVSQLGVVRHDVAASTMALGGQTTSPFDLKALGLEHNTLAALQTLTPEHLQMLITQQQQMAQQTIFDPGVQQQQQQQQQPMYGGPDQNWNGGHYDVEYEGASDERDRRWADGGRGRGRAGRGRGRSGRGEDGGFKSSKRKPCTFFAVGRCRYGDQCDFIHEGPGGSMP